MRNARPAARPHLAIALVFFLGTLNGSLNAAPAGDVPPAPPASAPPVPPVLLGKIAHIRIFGSKNISADLISSHLTQKVGDLYSPAAAAKDRAAIKDMGFFNGAVALSALPSPSGGVDLNYTVSEFPIVKSIRFTANTPSKEPTISAAVLLVQMKTRVGQVLNTTTLVSDLDALFNHSTGFVVKQGYVFDVSLDINIDPPTGVLIIPLVEDHIQSIRITGNNRVKTADILARMHTKVGDLYDGEALNGDISSIYEMGAFKEVQNFAGRPAGPNQVSITIPVVEHEVAQGTLDETRGKIVPFLYDPATVPLPVVQVSVNGRPPLPFVLDTGSGPALSLDPWAAREFGLKGGGPAEKSGDIAFTRTPVHGVVLQGATHGSDVAFDTPEALILDLSALQGLPGPRLAGIVGLGMLNPFTSRFDFAAKTLTVFAYPHPPLRLPGGTVLPLRSTSGGAFSVRATLARDAFADLVLDTGSTATQVPLSALGALHPTKTVFNSLFQRIDGVFSCPELHLHSLTFGALRVPDVVVNTMPPPTEPSLGLDILAGYRLTLDGPNGQAILEPSARGGRYVSGWVGIELGHTGEDYSVGALVDGSPAQRAGLQAGDELVTVGGVRVKGLGEGPVEYLLKGIAGTLLRVSVRRSGGEKALSWVPLDDSSAPRTALDGLTLKKANSSPWVVVSVLKGCPGDQAGLQVGDEITHMEGAFVADMSRDQLVRIMTLSSKSITLSVRRASRAVPFAVKLSRPPQPTFLQRP